MTETENLVLEHLHALREGQDDMRADLLDIRMHLRGMDEQLSGLGHLVSAFVTNDGEMERIHDRLEPRESQR